MSTITVSAHQRALLSLVAVDVDDWIANAMDVFADASGAVAARAAAAAEQMRASPLWPEAVATALTADIDVEDEAAVLQHGLSAGIIKTAAQRAAEAPPPAPPPSPPSAGVSASRQQVALEMLAREMVTSGEAIALAATGAAPAWIAALIEELPAEQRAPAHIALTYPTWWRDAGLLATLAALPGAPAIDIDEFFASAAAR